MTMVPIITLLLGYFPIALNFQTVLAITIYYLALNSLVFYCTGYREYKALWLANTATTIFWWPFLKASFLTPIKSCMGRGLAFKATAKGAGSVGASIKQIAPWVVLNILCVMAFFAGVVKLSANPSAPEIIALCWIVYNIVPHLLLVIYAYIGQSRLLDIICNVCIALSGSVSLVALIALWIFYPREADYSKAGTLSLAFLNAQRSGELFEGFPVTWRRDSGLQYVNTVNMTLVGDGGGVNKTFSDLSGGFYNDGDIGAVKLPFTVALTTTMLAWSLLDFPGFWKSDAVRLSSALDLLNHGAAFIHNCFGDADEFEDTLFVSQVGNIEIEHTLWRRAEDNTDEYVLSMRGADGPLDLAGQFVAAMVSSALAMEKYSNFDPVGAIDRAHYLFLNAAIAADDITSVSNTTGLYTQVAYTNRAVGLSSAPRDEELLDTFYPSTTFHDDLAWAASWLARASQDFRKYDAEVYYSELRMNLKAAYEVGDIPAVTYDYMNNAAVVHAASFTVDESYHRGAQAFFYDWLCDQSIDHTTLGRACQAEAPRLGNTADVAALAVTYVASVRRNPKLKGVYSGQLLKAFECFAESQGRYILGVGSTAITPRSSLIGYSKHGFDKTWHRGATCPTYPAPCGDQFSPEANNRPDENVIKGGLLWADVCTDSDSDRKGRTQSTVVSLENNAGTPLLWAGLARKERAWVQCLQGVGAFTSGGVCKQARPLRDRKGPYLNLNMVELQ